MKVLEPFHATWIERMHRGHASILRAYGSRSLYKRPMTGLFHPNSRTRMGILSMTNLPLPPSDSNESADRAGGPASASDLISLLEQLGIPYRHYHHPPVFTVEEAQHYCKDFPGAHIKNLFLRNKPGKMWLVTARDTQLLDLKRLGEQLGAGRLSFGSPERLMAFLGVIPGAVTPFAVINDHQHTVQPVLDRSLLEAEWINAHPLRNDQTLAIAPRDLLRVFTQLGFQPLIFDFSSGGP